MGAEELTGNFTRSVLHRESSQVPWADRGGDVGEGTVEVSLKHADTSQETGRDNGRPPRENGDIQNLVVASIKKRHCGGKVKQWELQRQRLRCRDVCSWQENQHLNLRRAVLDAWSCI